MFLQMWCVRKEGTVPDVDTLVRNTVSGHVTPRTESVPHVLLDGWDPNAWKVNKKQQPYIGSGYERFEFDSRNFLRKIILILRNPLIYCLQNRQTNSREANLNERKCFVNILVISDVARVLVLNLNSLFFYFKNADTKACPTTCIYTWKWWQMQRSHEDVDSAPFSTRTSVSVIKTPTMSEITVNIYMYIFVLPFSNKSRKNMNVDNYNTPALVYLMKTVTCAFLDGL